MLPQKDDFDDYEIRKKWYEELQNVTKTFPLLTDQEMIQLKEEAKKCHDAEVANNNIRKEKTNSNHHWMKTVMSKGTVADKLAAYTVSIQDNPVCSLEQLRGLVGMVKVGKKNECTGIIQNLTELLLTELLIPNRKLKPFFEQPLSLLNDLTSGNAKTRRKYLSYWYFEDQLKEIYVSYILSLNAVSRDTLDANKEKAIAAMYKLLAGNPEQEKNLLSHIVNKLGDPSQKVASKAIYCLSQLLHQHSNMQGVVLKEVEKLLFRPNVSSKAQYYSLCFLSQFYLSHESSEVARKLIEVYFSFFKACIKKGEVDSRMMSALLMGVNRAYPYAKLEFEKVSEHVNTMYRVVHIASFNVSLHALQLLYQVSDYADNVNDRFYSALYRKLTDLKVTTTTHQAMLLNLIYKSLMKDSKVERIKVFIKRLLQLATMGQPPFACGILFLVSQVLSKKAECTAFTLEKTFVVEFPEDEGDEIYADVKDDNDKCIKIKEDDDKCVEVKEDDDKCVEVKEDDKSVEVKEDDDKCIEIKEENVPKIENLDERTECTKSNEGCKVVDLNDVDIKPDLNILEGNEPVSSSWFHCKVKTEDTHKPINEFNPMARNPLYAGAKYCAYIELTSLSNHFHPTVSLFANQIMKGEIINYPSDPLKDFALIRFLDRFAFKNPKKSEEINNQGAHPTFGKRKLYKPPGIRSLSVSSVNYLEHKNVPVDELFLHTYLQKKYHESGKKERDSDLDSVCSEEFEEILNKMSGKNLEEDEEMDYMCDVGENLKKIKNNKKKKTEENSEDENELSDDDIEEDFSEEDNDENEDIDDIPDEDKELIGDLDNDDNMSDILFDSDEDESELKGKKNKNIKKGKFDSIFASADEFASMLEDEGASKNAPGSSNQYANQDKAVAKQIDWEEKRNRWVKGYNKAVGKKSEGKFSQKNKKRSNKNQFANKNKKQKRF